MVICVFKLTKEKNWIHLVLSDSLCFQNCNSNVFFYFIEHSRLFMANQGKEAPRPPSPKRMVNIHFFLGGGGVEDVF